MLSRLETYIQQLQTDPVNFLITMAYTWGVILFSLILHECAHGYVALRCGDPTAKLMGRLSLNPLRHLDLWGTLMILTVGIGYAKPVPVNTRNLRNYKRDTILVSLAGPLSNFLMAILYAGIFRVCMLFIDDTYVLFWLWVVLIQIIVSVNISLMVFNLLPVPPLDGSRLWSSLLPGRWAFKLEQYSRYITIALFAALWFGVLDVPLALLRSGAGRLIGFILGEPNLFNIYALLG